MARKPRGLILCGRSWGVVILFWCFASCGGSDATPLEVLDEGDSSSQNLDVQGQDSSDGASAVDAALDANDAHLRVGGDSLDSSSPPEAICPGNDDVAPELSVAPYLQNASPHSIWVLWETFEGEESRVAWGETEALGEVSCGTTIETLAGSRVHEVQLEGLKPATEYFYRASTGATQSEIHRFVTPPQADFEASFRLAAMSDMQRDYNKPWIFQEIVEDGIMAVLAEEFGPEPADELGLVLIPGDLVDSGWVYSQWAEEFFLPAGKLMAQVPFYPVLGNHEAGSPFFFDYFNFPLNGSEGFEEHWWHIDYSNLRIIGMDSNYGFRLDEQLEWLEGVLAESCDLEFIDFVFVELHHPHKSELWPDGDTDFTGDVVNLLETFSDECGKPSIHFFGHTHGYSRGQSRDHRHLWVNVASAGGNLDYWSEYAQIDHPEFTVSQDEWGFVLVEVDAGEDPKLRLRRFSRGNENLPRDNEVRDELVVHRFSAKPAKPVAVSPNSHGICPAQVKLEASAFSDPDGDGHHGTDWQLSLSCEDFSSPIMDVWQQFENWYLGANTLLGASLESRDLAGLSGGQVYCWRVRYRDTNLIWSEWSNPSQFSTDPSVESGNLLVNPDAETGKTGWVVVEGFLESLEEGECNGIAPHSGSSYFVVGGVCEAAAYSEARQQVEIPEQWWADIDAQKVTASYGGYMANWSGHDRPEIKVVFRDALEAEIQESDVVSSMTPIWTYAAAAQVVPVGARSVDFVLMGTRLVGGDNDAYFDDLRFTLAGCGAGLSE